MQRYNPKELEPKWQKVWQDTKIYQTEKDDSRPKKYIIDMFPYPSGAAMHVGHVRNFTISDVLSQYHRQKGYNVLHTMGWDTFGLPAENYAIKTGTPPAISTKANIANFKSQLTALGMSYDWNREITTSDPEYYKWTQWIFTKLHEKGLAYQAERAQWWCNTDKTVLANEQVEAGKCWRCGNEVVKKSLNQWFFKITDYAEQLLEGIDDLDWPEKIKTMQRNWIGKSIGAEIGFKIDGSDQTITVFTTRPDTLFGATFMVLAPEHPLVSQLTSENEKSKVESYIKLTAQKSDVERQETDREKTGVFTGSYAINPANNEKIPIWIADYVLSGYGTGAIMAVPAHDERDYEFAQKFEIPVVRVIDPVTGEKQNDPVSKQKIVCVVQNENGEILTIKWKPELGGRLLVGGGIEEGEEPSATAKREIAEETGYTDVELVEVGDETVFHEYYAFSKKMPVRAVSKLVYYKLKSNAQIDTAHEATEKNNFVVEWVKPDQAYREIHDDQHLRALDRFIFNRVYTAEGLMANSGKYNGLPSSEAREKIVADLAKQNAGKERINYKIRDWLISRQRYWGTPIPIIHCPDHGAVSVPEKDLPVILPEVKSFEPTGEGSALAGVSAWVNTTCPTCGGPAKRETDTMDGYACSSWYFLRYADANNAKQAWDPNIANYWLPIDYYCGGDHAVSHLLYSRFWMYFFADQGLIEKSRREPVGKLVYNGYILSHDGQKMSKSKGNVINPDELISQGYGADSLRLFEMFIAPYEQNTNWNTNGVPGTFRFLQRFWTLTNEFLDAPKDDVTDEVVLKTAHQAVARVSAHLDNLVFNNAVSTLMESVNNLYKLKAKTDYSGTSSWQFALEAITKLLAPFAPHISEELWQQLGNEGSVHISNWPVHDPKYLSSDTMTIVVQVNGKVRGQIDMPTESTEEQVIEHAKTNVKVASYLAGQSVKKTIYVQAKLVNFVI